jgi:hypothetical protein
MKILELTKNKLFMPLTNEEYSLLEKFSNDPISKVDLTEREQIIANQLTVKDVLVRINENGKITYKKIK